MMHLNYNAPHLAQAEERLGRLMDDDRERSKVLFLTAADTPAEAVDSYLRLGRQLDSLKQAGKIDSHAGVTSFVVDSAEQLLRLERWRKFWTPQRREVLRAGIREGERRYGFAEGAFDGALELAGREYTKLDYSSPAAREVFREWIDGHGATPIFLSHVTLPDSCKHEVYAVFSAADDIVVADRAFYAGKMARSVNRNFYLILSISSILVTAALFLCYGRIELTLMSLLPMAVGWVIILGLVLMTTTQNALLCWIGVGMIAMSAIFSLVTLPVEYNASARAVEWLQTSRTMQGAQLAQAKEALSWAARTYLVAALSAIASVLYYVFLILGRRD